MIEISMVSPELDLLDATANALTSPIREHEASLPVRAAKRIKDAQKRCESLERDLKRLTVRLGDRWAQNALSGQANPAEEAQATDIAWEVEVKKNELGELQDLLESLTRLVALLEDALASKEKTAEEPLAEENPSDETAAEAADPEPEEDAEKTEETTAGDQAAAASPSGRSPNTSEVC